MAICSQLCWVHTKIFAKEGFWSLCTCNQVLQHTSSNCAVPGKCAVLRHGTLALTLANHLQNQSCISWSQQLAVNFCRKSIWIRENLYRDVETPVSKFAQILQIAKSTRAFTHTHTYTKTHSLHWSLGLPTTHRINPYNKAGCWMGFVESRKKVMLCVF